MKAALYVLFGAGFTAATSLALGLILIRRLAIRLHGMEERLLAFVAGSACLSAVMFVLCSIQLARKGVFLAVGVFAIAAALRTRAAVPDTPVPTPLPLLWKWVFGALFAGFGLFYLIHAMAPEMSPDGSAYHLAMVQRYYQARGFERITSDLYANLSQGLELLFLFAFAFGRHSSAALVHFTFLASLPLLILSYARRAGFPPAASVTGAMLPFLAPLVGVVGASAYNDVALAVVLFVLFYLLQIWDVERNNGLFYVAAMLAGFGYAIKYTAALAAPYALVFVGWKLWRARHKMLRPLLAMSAVSALFIAPWMIKNFLWVGNPVSPFANSLFPNPYVHLSFETDYRRDMRSYGLSSYREIPWELTVRGAKLQGLFGPLFLLTPLSLLALRNKNGRQLLLAAIVFALPWTGNIGARFLIPAAPFLSLALASVIGSWPPLALALIAAHAILSIPSVVTRYCDEYVWRITNAPWKAALRIENDETFLNREFANYRIVKMVERKVPPGSSIFSFGDPSQAYSNNDFRVRYLSAESETLGVMLLTPMAPDMVPSRSYEFSFPSTDLRGLRVAQTASAEEQWSLSEVRAFANGVELPRLPAWRLTAQPNPWDVQMAFDNNPVTRWQSWQPARPGMKVDIDFGGIERVDQVRLECSRDQYDIRMQIEGMDAAGYWRTLSHVPRITAKRVDVNLRAAATAELKARGIRYLLIRGDDYFASDYADYETAWGIHFVAQQDDAKLFWIR